MIFYDLPMHSSPFRVCVFCAHSRGPLGRQTFKFTATPLFLGLGFDASHLFLVSRAFSTAPRRYMTTERLHPLV